MKIHEHYSENLKIGKSEVQHAAQTRVPRPQLPQSCLLPVLSQTSEKSGRHNEERSKFYSSQYVAKRSKRKATALSTHSAFYTHSAFLLGPCELRCTLHFTHCDLRLHLVSRTQCGPIKLQVQPRLRLSRRDARHTTPAVRLRARASPARDTGKVCATWSGHCLPSSRIRVVRRYLNG